MEDGLEPRVGRYERVDGDYYTDSEGMTWEIRLLGAGYLCEQGACREAADFEAITVNVDEPWTRMLCNAHRGALDDRTPIGPAFYRMRRSGL